MSSSDNLRTAKQTANDEFYTDFTDIQKEVLLYLQNFKDKVVYRQIAAKAPCFSYGDEAAPVKTQTQNNL